MAPLLDGGGDGKHFPGVRGGFLKVVWKFKAKISNWMVGLGEHGANGGGRGVSCYGKGF